MSAGRGRRALVRGTLAILLLAAAAGGVWRWRRSPVLVRAHVVDRGPVQREAFGTGLLESATSVDVGFDLPGRVVELSVDEGDEVRPGQVLGSIDAADLEGQLAVAEANRRLAEQTAARSAVDVERTRTLHESARADLARAERLFASGAIARAELDVAATRAATADAEHRAAVASRSQAAQSIDVARRTRGVAEIIAGRVHIRSPMGGVVVRREQDVGAFLQPGQPVFRVVDPRRLRVRAWVDEAELSHLETGQVARVVLRSDPDRSIAGEVERIGREVDRQTHEVLVDVALVEPLQRFAVGQRADVYIATATVDQAVRVPVELCSLADRSCFVERAGTAARVSVEPGLVGARFFEAKRGLDAGDVVVASLRPGEAIPAHRPLRHADAP